MAKRVTESKTIRTFAPWSRKNSAIARATKTGAHAHGRRTIRSGHYHHGTLHSFGPQFMFQKLADLAVPFADQRDDGDVGRTSLRHHTQQSALADAAASENTHPLPFAARQ